MPKSNWTPEVLESIKARYLAGETTYQISQTYEVSPDWIANLLRRSGVQLRPRGVPLKMTPEVHAKMLELYRSGNTMEEIEIALGISRSLTCRALKSAGVMARPAAQRDTRLAQDRTQICKCCGERKSFSAFAVAKGRALNGRRAVCLRCDYYKHVERTFGVTKQQFFSMLDAQGNACAICRKTLDLTKQRAVHVDHNHATGVVRELLCPDCNKGLGCYHDSPALLRAAADYAERHANSKPTNPHHDLFDQLAQEGRLAEAAAVAEAHAPAVTAP
jgi:hypothetical protein